MEDTVTRCTMLRWALILLFCFTNLATRSRAKFWNTKTSDPHQQQQQGIKDEYTALSGDDAYKKAQELFAQQDFVQSAQVYWVAVMRGGTRHTTEDAFNGVMKSFEARGVMDEGLVFIAEQYAQHKQLSEARVYFNQALQLNPNNTAAMLRLADIVDDPQSEKGKQQKLAYLVKAFDVRPQDAQVNLQLGNFLFEVKQWQSSIEHMHAAYTLDASLTEAASSVIYLRSSMCMWGKKGGQFLSDMQKVRELVEAETKSSFLQESSMRQQSVVHPHMALAYPLKPELKLAIARSHARAEKVLVQNSGLQPFNHSSPDEYKQEASRPAFRIKIGYASANIKSKTTVYMAQDLMRFHDRSRFEVHVYATSDADHPEFLKQSMRGVDWREKVRLSVEHFHDTSQMDVLATARLIRSHGIHILMNWDGYSNNGVRATGLFPLQPAPIQIAHQEYIGTMGADYVQYLIADQVACPPKYGKFYSERFLYMPHSFLANSFAYMQPELQPPAATLPADDNPSVNRCGLPANRCGLPASEGTCLPAGTETFVYCNFNKHLKFDPQLFSDWLHTLQQVEGSLLCLLENPADSIQHIAEFVNDFDPSLSDRVGFLPFMANPFDNQRRSARYCHAVLDTTVYNGHTTAVDALYGAVPVVTRGDQKDMGARVGASVLTALGVPELIAPSARAYSQLAVRLARDAAFYRTVRDKLVAAATAQRPRNPYWDLRRYVHNLEKGFTAVWEDLAAGAKPRHVYVDDDYVESGLHLEEDTPIEGDFRSEGGGGAGGGKKAGKSVKADKNKYMKRISLNDKKGEKKVEKKGEKKVEKKGEKKVEKKGEKKVEKKGEKKKTAKSAGKKGEKKAEKKGIKKVEKKGDRQPLTPRSRRFGGERSGGGSSSVGSGGGSSSSGGGRGSASSGGGGVSDKRRTSDRADSGDEKGGGRGRRKSPRRRQLGRKGSGSGKRWSRKGGDEL